MPQAEQEQCGVVAEREADRLKPDLGVHHRDELVTFRIPLHLERGHHNAEILFELFLRTECEPAHPRVQAIRPDDEIEIAGAPALKRDPNALTVVGEGSHGVAEHQLHRAAEGVVDHRGEVRSRDAHIPLVRLD